MWQTDEVLKELNERIKTAEKRYADFTSTHEALGVALEEWNELQSAIQTNAIENICWEAIDLAVVLIRMVRQCRNDQEFKKKSIKKI